MTEAIRHFLTEEAGSVKDRATLEAAKRRTCKLFGLAAISNEEIIAGSREAGEEISPMLAKIVRKRAVRTLSGIAPVAVLTKSYPCPGSCAYCPREKEVPVSYLSNEPAVMRAIMCGYDPYKQVSSRLRALERNGHEPTKIELIVIGGTWSYLPKKYKFWYILNCYKAANDHGKKRLEPYSKSFCISELENALEKEKKKNEKGQYKIVGLTLETRPDYINEKELLEMRVLGCTRVEMGVQAVDDEILKKNRRGHGVHEVARATKLLKQYGFKVTYHIMPALPGSDPKKDVKLFKALFSDERFQPDQIKFYPTVVTKGSLLYKWYKAGKYEPYSDKELQKLIIDCKAIVPKYVRIIRLIRDIPGESIVAGNRITNLRQIMKKEGAACRCIRCREIKDGKIGDYRINVLSYSASGGTEHFISADSPDGSVLYGFCRLRIDENSPIAPAIIRELHVYGELVSPGKTGSVQHKGLGGKLLAKAQDLAQSDGARKLAVISGVGVREYYKKFGYRRQDEYMNILTN